MPILDLQMYRNVKLEGPPGITSFEKLLSAASSLSTQAANRSLPVPDPESPEKVSSLVEKGSGVFFDITRQLGSEPVEFEEMDGGVDQFTFTIKHGAAVWIEFTKVGHRARLEAGYMVDIPVGDPSLDFGDLIGGTKRQFMEGVVTAVRPSFPDNGKLELQVTVESDLFLLTRNKPGTITYPNSEDKPGTLQHRREFQLGRTTMRISDIVRGIVTEYGIPIKSIVIEDKYDYTFSGGVPAKGAPPTYVTQNPDESDFDFIHRLLTGRNRAAAPGRRTVGTSAETTENVTINAHARMWMEYDPELKRSFFRVAPEKDLVSDVNNDLTFVYNIVGQEVVAPNQFNPQVQKTQLVITGVRLTDDPDTARGREAQVAKDVSTTPEAGTDGGEQQADVNDFSDEEWEALGDLIKKDYEDGLLDAGALTEYQRGRLGKQYLKRYITTRKRVDQPSGRPTSATNETSPNKVPPPAGIDADAVPDVVTPDGEGPVLGTGSGGTDAPATANSPSRTKSKKVRHFGQSLSFETRGNIFMQARKTYQVRLGVNRYSGLWYAVRVRHSFGNTYRMTVDMAR